MHCNLTALFVFVSFPVSCCLLCCYYCACGKVAPERWTTSAPPREPAPLCCPSCSAFRTYRAARRSPFLKRKLRWKCPLLNLKCFFLSHLKRNQETSQTKCYQMKVCCIVALLGNTCLKVRIKLISTLWLIALISRSSQPLWVQMRVFYATWPYLRITTWLLTFGKQLWWSWLTWTAWLLPAALHTATPPRHTRWQLDWQCLND